MNSLLVDQRFEATTERGLNSVVDAVVVVSRKSLALVVGALALLSALTMVFAILSAGFAVAVGAISFIALVFLSFFAVNLWVGRE